MNDSYLKIVIKPNAPKELIDMIFKHLDFDGAIHGLRACYMVYTWMKRKHDSVVLELNKVIESQRHELALLNKFREEDKFARQMLDKNACQRRVEELEKELDIYYLKNKYSYFSLSEKLLQPKWGTEYEALSFARFIPTGDCEFYDYGSGFHYVTVCCVKDRTPKGEDKFRSRIYYCTRDDGDYGGWGEPTSKEEAEKQVKAIGDIYVMLDKLPCESLMNYLLKDLNITVGYE